MYLQLVCLICIFSICWKVQGTNIRYKRNLKRHKNREITFLLDKKCFCGIHFYEIAPLNNTHSSLKITVVLGRFKLHTLYLEGINV